MRRAGPLIGISAMVLTGLLAACGTPPVSSAGPSHWLQVDAGQKAVAVKLFAGEHNGMNFNGYGSGRMTVTVPAGWRVAVRFINRDEAQAHSAMIVPFKEHTAMNIPVTAVTFPRASTPDPTEGTQYGLSQTFRFTATKIGHYALACGVPGHAAMGMWDNFVVSGTATTPSVTFHGSH